MLILEDGTGKTDSNTYVLEAAFADWLNARGYTVTTASDILLTLSADYLETLIYKGDKTTSTQSMQFPRKNLYIDGSLFADDAIPKELINAQMQTAYAIDKGFNPLSTIDRAIKKEKIDVLEVEYMDNAKTSATIRAVNSTIRKLLKSSGASFKANFSV